MKSIGSYVLMTTYQMIRIRPSVIFNSIFYKIWIINYQDTANQKPILKKSPICYTCKSFIDDLPYRFLIVKDRCLNHKFLSFHYFFPCWDVDYICQNLIKYEIFKAGFCCDESVLKNPQLVNNLRKNSDLWDIWVISRFLFYFRS